MHRQMANTRRLVIFGLAIACGIGAIGLQNAEAEGTRVWVRSLLPSTGFNADCDTAIFQMPAPLPPDAHFDFIGLHDPTLGATDAVPLQTSDCQDQLDTLVATTSNADFRLINGFPDADARLKNLRSNEVPKPASPDGTRFFLPPEGATPPPFPPTNSLPNAPLTLGEFRDIGGKMVLKCAGNGSASLRISLKGYTPNEVLTVWGIWLATPPGAPGPTIVPLPLGGTPNVIVPDRRGQANFERQLSFCPMDTAPDGSQLLVIDIAAHWDGSAYGAVPDVPLPNGVTGAAATFIDPVSEEPFTSVIGAGIVTVNRGIIRMRATKF